MAHISPSVLDASHINKVVVVQTFERDPKHLASLLPDTLRKYVGTLEGYSIASISNTTIVKLAGMDPIAVDGAQDYVELYLVSR